MTKKCEFCGKPIDIRSEPYVDVHPNGSVGKMESYHTGCLYQKIQNAELVERRSL